MISEFMGWEKVSSCLNKYVKSPIKMKRNFSLNDGQRASLKSIAERIPNNGVVIADEVGMGKTCIAVELTRSVVESGGRVAILVPPGLGYQWHDELRMGEVYAPLLLRSLSQYLSAWGSDRVEKQQPWFMKRVVVISHAFTNWRLSANADPWRWSLFPEFYARWRKRTTGRLPKGYNNCNTLYDNRVINAAKSICDAISNDELNQLSSELNQLSEQSGNTLWTKAKEAGQYGRNEKLRPWLERSVGLGLGIFDLVIIDEAHKSRGQDTGLSHLLSKVVLPSANVRHLAMTATPVEIDVIQWRQTLSRIGVTNLEKINQAIEDYAIAIKQIRQTPNIKETRDSYKRTSAAFQKEMSPYLLRRDKREEPAVQKFKEYSGLQIYEYRCERDILIETASLETVWKQAVCAAEALSVVTSLSENSIAKRLRLTLGNGHGISALIDQCKRSEMDRHQEEFDQLSDISTVVPEKLSKREERAQWWLNVIKSPYPLINGDDVLFDHPAIKAAIQAIEAETEQGRKVLVFGRFTKPMRALVDILNAREMLRCLQSNRLWPQSKVHGDSKGDRESSEWPAIEAAYRQLQCSIHLEKIDSLLNEQYNNLEKLRTGLRRRLLDKLDEGFQKNKSDDRLQNLYIAFKESIESTTKVDNNISPLTLVCNALYELLGAQAEDTIEPTQLTDAFIQLLNALSDRSEGDQDGDGNLDREEAADLWPVLLERLNEEYNRPQGGFARLMYGGTKQESRRMIQLAFNRSNSFPKVLVAQSMVGKEGLNLHKACRIVVLLHPEWNPGVTEQQIGRIDRVGSEWEMQLDKAIKDGWAADRLPRIEIRPVIFKGTYDEYNWSVLRERWDDLRAQLHGVVIPSRLTNSNDESLRLLIEEISRSAPNFSPANKW